MLYIVQTPLYGSCSFVLSFTVSLIINQMRLDGKISILAKGTEGRIKIENLNYVFCASNTNCMTDFFIAL